MIRQKLLEIQKAVRGLAKDAKAYNYDYVSGSRLLSFLRPKMDEVGVLLTPEILGVEPKEVRQQKWDSRSKQAYEETKLLYILKMRMTWIDTEDGDSMPLEWIAAGENAIDKGYGAALTYGERYFLMKFFHIATDEDDVDAKPEEHENPKDRREKQGPPAEERRYLDAETWRKVVAGAARGERTKGGQTLRYWFIKNYAPDEAYLRQFDGDVRRAKEELAAASAPAESPGPETADGGPQSAGEELFDHVNPEGND